MLILRNKGFHKFVLTILPWSLFNTLMVLSYSAFVSKLFISNNSLILRSCMLGNFVRAFGCSQLNCSQSLECSVAPDASHFPFMVSSWCSIDRVSTSFFVSPVSLPQSQALKSESGKKDTSQENLRQTVSKILSKTIGKKQNNLSNTQRAALKQLKNNEQMKSISI